MSPAPTNATPEAQTPACFPSPTAQVNLAGANNTLLAAVRPAHVTVPQSFCVDPASGYVYISQLIPGGIQLAGEAAPVPYSTRESSGDLAISKLSLADGALMGVMYIRGAGHGMTLQVEHDLGGTSWLWCDADSAGDGFAQALARVQFQDGAALDSRTQTGTLYRPFGPGAHGLSAAIDQANGRIMVRRAYPDPGNGRRYYLFNLAAFKLGLYPPLATVDQAASSTCPDGLAIGVFQGGATWGDFLYSLEGTATNGGKNTTYLTCLSWLTGKVMQRVFVTHEPELEYREPEGLDIWTPDPTQPQNVKFGYGFAGGPGGDRTFTVSTIDGFIQP